MPFVSQRLGVAYFPIPKVGGTSIRHALYRLETGRDFVPSLLPSGEPMELWMHFPATAFDEIPVGAFDSYERIVVVRHPLDRLVSAYRNRVGHYREVERADFSRHSIDASVPTNPDFDAFCRHLPEYRKIASIRHHTQPQAMYLGGDLSFFSRVFCLERIEELEAYLSCRTATPVALPRLRADGTAKDQIAISDESRSAVRSYYRRDFDLLGALYR